jgi:hypothetical protein
VVCDRSSAQQENGGGADVLPLFCWSMIRKSGYRFSEKIMLKSKG